MTIQQQCISCDGTGEQSSSHGNNYPKETCSVCYGDKFVFVENNIDPESTSAKLARDMSSRN